MIPIPEKVIKNNLTVKYRERNIFSLILKFQDITAFNSLMLVKALLQKVPVTLLPICTNSALMEIN